MLNARADLSAARESLINARTNKVIATFSLLNATGRLTAHDVGLSVQVKTATPYILAVEDVWRDLRTITE